MSSALSRQRHESKAVNAATMAVDDERFLTGGGIRSPELIAHAGLLQCDFAHELRANDLANIEAFHCQRLLLIGCAHDFSGDRIELFARVILRGHVLRFHHHEDVEVLRCGGVAEQDLVIDD